MTKIALAQTTSTDDFDANLKVAEGMVGEAADQGAALLAFPEVFLYLGGYKGKLKFAEALDGAMVSRFRAAAARHNIMLLLGSFHERIPEQVQADLIAIAQLIDDPVKKAHGHHGLRTIVGGRRLGTHLAEVWASVRGFDVSETGTIRGESLLE